jgi:hypothetical protein
MIAATGNEFVGGLIALIIALLDQRHGRGSFGHRGNSQQFLHSARAKINAALI